MHLNALLLGAHALDDKPALVTLYQAAARSADSETAKAFYLTHAYVYALEIAHPDAAGLRAELIAMGRETPLQPSV